MNREQRRQLKSKFTKRNERDMFGTPINRANTWGNRTNDPKNPKRDRREWKNKKGE